MTCTLGTAEWRLTHGSRTKAASKVATRSRKRKYSYTARCESQPASRGAETSGECLSVLWFRAPGRPGPRTPAAAGGPDTPTGAGAKTLEFVWFSNGNIGELQKPRDLNEHQEPREPKKPRKPQKNVMPLPFRNKKNPSNYYRLIHLLSRSFLLLKIQSVQKFQIKEVF